MLKALGIAHKTEQNAVRLGIGNRAQAETAAYELLDLGERVYVEAMHSAVAELLVGITRDTQFGLVLTLGSGGILVEILKDSKTLLLPCPRAEIEDALNQLRTAPLLHGYRGRPRGDIEATIDAIMAIQNYAVTNAERLVELDVNPLLVGAEGTGVHAADALIVLQEQANV